MCVVFFFVIVLLINRQVIVPREVGTAMPPPKEARGLALYRGLRIRCPESLRPDSGVRVRSIP